MKGDINIHTSMWEDVWLWWWSGQEVPSNWYKAPWDWDWYNVMAEIPKLVNIRKQFPSRDYCPNWNMFLRPCASAAASYLLHLVSWLVGGWIGVAVCDGLARLLSSFIPCRKCSFATSMRTMMLLLWRQRHDCSWVPLVCPLAHGAGTYTDVPTTQFVEWFALNVY